MMRPAEIANIDLPQILLMRNLMPDLLTKPEDFFFEVHVLSVWIPLTYYNVFSCNNRLDIAYTPSDTQSLVIPEGNRNIDLLLDFLNTKLRHGYEVTYDEATIRYRLPRLISNITILSYYRRQPAGTCWGLPWTTC
jgi:hypothetical protein